MSKNKLYNQSYFVKRLIDAGLFVTRLNIKFEEDDNRRWMIIVNGKNMKYRHNICITCFKYKDKDDDEVKFSFKFQGQKLQDFMFDTKSMVTICQILCKTIYGTDYIKPKEQINDEDEFEMEDIVTNDK